MSFISAQLFTGLTRYTDFDLGNCQGCGAELQLLSMFSTLVGYKVPLKNPRDISLVAGPSTVTVCSEVLVLFFSVSLTSHGVRITSLWAFISSYFKAQFICSLLYEFLPELENILCMSLWVSSKQCIFK